jgi:sortase (surface protein transpeptidase)
MGKVCRERLRKLGLYTAAPGALAVVFAIGLAATWLPPFPRAITSSIGPTFGAIGEPVSLEIPSLQVKAQVVPIDLEGDVLEPPADVKKVGWWSRSAQPGSKTGQTLMTGHSARAGYSPMNNLRDIQRGASILIRSEDKQASYLVQRVVVWSKQKVAEHSDDLFDPEDHARRLVLVTSANFDGRVWRGNVIVFAQPI